MPVYVRPVHERAVPSWLRSFQAVGDPEKTLSELRPEEQDRELVKVADAVARLTAGRAS